MKTGLSIAILLLAIVSLAACDGGSGTTVKKAGAADCVLDTGALDGCTLG